MPLMSQFPSISFDQAATHYDRTRVTPDTALEQAMDVFIRETGATRAARILEIGIGTGRMALPLCARGIGVIGIDLSMPMMDELKKKTNDDENNIALAQADAVTLPFRDEIFDIAYAVHVFHLVAGWRDALNDARRVLKRGGLFLLSFHHRDAGSANRKLRQQLWAMAQAHGIDTQRPGAASEAELTGAISAWGADVRIVHAARWRESQTPARVLEEIVARIYSDTWQVPPEAMAEIAPRLREWAEGEFGDMNRAVEVEERISWVVARK